MFDKKEINKYYNRFENLFQSLINKLANSYPIGDSINYDKFYNQFKYLAYDHFIFELEEINGLFEDFKICNEGNGNFKLYLKYNIKFHSVSHNIKINISSEAQRLNEFSKIFTHPSILDKISKKK